MAIEDWPLKDECFIMYKIIFVKVILNQVTSYKTIYFNKNNFYFSIVYHRMNLMLVICRSLDVWIEWNRNEKCTE